MRSLFASLAFLALALSAVNVANTNGIPSLFEGTEQLFAAAPGAAKKAAPASGKCNPRSGTGTLEVRFGEGMPEGVRVSVVGPNRFRRTGLTPGRNYIYQRVRTGKYTVAVTGAAARRFESHELIDTAFYLSADPLNPCVPKNGTIRVTVGYVPEPGSGKMWVGSGAGSPYSLYSVGRDAMQENGTPNPVVTYSRMRSPQKNIAFDKQGNLWIAGGGRIEQYARNQLGRSRQDAQPDVVLSGQNGDHLAFDAAGGLWYSNRYEGKVFRLAPNQLTQSGQPVPSVVISGFTRPRGVAFDRARNLWIIDDIESREHVIHRYNVARLNRSTDEPGDVRLTVGALVGEPPRFAQFSNPAVLTFDQENNLWVAFWNERKIAKITPAEQERGGEIASSVNLTCCGGMIMATMMFDNAGGLWVAGSPTGDIVRFNPDQLGAYAEAPAIRINPATEVDAWPDGIFLNPSPSWSPLNDR